MLSIDWNCGYNLLGCCLLIASAAKIDFGCCLSIGISTTIDFDCCLMIEIAAIISFGYYCLLIEIAAIIDFGCAVYINRNSGYIHLISGAVYESEFRPHTLDLGCCISAGIAATIFSESQDRCLGNGWGRNGAFGRSGHTPID